MKLSIPTKLLRDAVARLSSIPGAHGAAPHTQAVRFTADMQGLTLMRYTNEAQVSIVLEDVEIEDEEGVPAVAHAALTRLLGGLTDETAKLSSDEKHIHFVCGSTKAKLAVFGEEAVMEPPFEEKGDLKSVLIPGDDFRAAMSDVAPAMSRNDAKPQFCGVCIRQMAGKLALIASDTKRGHVAYLDSDLDVDCLIADSGVEMILKALSSEVEAVRLAVGENNLTLTGGDSEISLSLLNANFPNVEDFIHEPTPSIKSKCAVLRDELSTSLKKCAGIADGDTRKVSVDMTKANITLAATDGLGSDLQTEVACKATQPMKFGMPAMQVAHSLDMMPVDEEGRIEIELRDTSLFLRSPSRVAFIALMKNTEPK